MHYALLLLFNFNLSLSLSLPLADAIAFANANLIRLDTFTQCSSNLSLIPTATKNHNNNNNNNCSLILAFHTFGFNCVPKMKREGKYHTSKGKVRQRWRRRRRNCSAGRWRRRNHLHKTNNNFSRAELPECVSLCEWESVSVWIACANVARSDECKTIRHTRAAQSPSTHAEKGDRAREREAGRAKSVTSNMHQLIHTHVHILSLSYTQTHTYRDRHLYICNLKMLIGNQNGGALPAVAVAVAFAASSVGSRQVRFVVARWKGNFSSG